MALYLLEFLSNKWESNPPFEELRDYHENFSNYRSNLLGTAFSRIDMVKYQISNEWIKNQVVKLMDRESYNRGKLLIVAYEILDLFKESEKNWQMLPYIGRSSVPSPPEDPTDVTTIRKTNVDFNKLIDAVPEEIKPFVRKLADKFGVFEEQQESE